MIPRVSEMDAVTARALLEWQVELGADEAILDAPVNRYAAPATPVPKPARAAPVAPLLAAEVDPVAEAEALAAAAASLPELAEAMAGYEHCELKKGARNLVFSDGSAGARVMVVGEAPGRDEDLAGKPFVGRAGQLLDRMFAAIGLSRGSPNPASALYITNVMVWRPPGNRDPEPAEVAMMLPFLRRHIEVADPDLLVLMGNTPCGALLGQKGILKLRGRWTEVLGRPAMPMTHPAYLLRNPAAKREAWADLLEVQARLEGA